MSGNILSKEYDRAALHHKFSSRFMLNKRLVDTMVFNSEIAGDKAIIARSKILYM